MDSEEKIKLVLDVAQSIKDTETFSDKLKLAANAADIFGDSALGALVKKSAEVIATLREQASTAKDATESTKASLGALAEGGAGLFTAFQAGDVSAAIEGVTGLVTLIPGLNAFAPAIELGGKAAAAAWPLLKEWGGYFADVNAKVKEATANVKEYAGALKDANAALKESDELAKAKAADKAAEEEVGKKAKERGETFESLTKGRQEATLKEVAQAVQGSDETQQNIMEAQKRYEEEVNKGVGPEKPGEDMFVAEQRRKQKVAAAPKYKAAIDKIGEESQGTAEDLIARARKGDADAIAELQKLLPEDSVTRDVARMASPEAQDEAKEDKRFIAQQEQEHKDRQAYEKAHPEIAREREAERKAEARREDQEGLRSGGFETLPELGGPSAESAPKGLGIHNDIGRGLAPSGRAPALQGEGISPISRPKPEHVRPHKAAAQGASPQEIAQVLAVVQTGVGQTAQQNSQIASAIEQIRAMQSQVQGGIARNRSAQSTGGP